MQLMFLAPVALAFNDDPNQVAIDEALKLKLEIIDQTYPNKGLIIKLTINPQIDSGKTAITWYYDSNILKPVGSDEDIISLTNGNSVELTKEFIPLTKYSLLEDYEHVISVKVAAAAYDRNYINTARLELVFNKDFENTPLLDSYISHKNLYNVLTTALYCLVGAMVVALITLAIKRFISYLNSDDS
jgi:hypothetical protein